jgi:hypothetical protein
MTMICSILYADDAGFVFERIIQIQEITELSLSGSIDVFLTQSDEVSVVLKAKREADFDNLIYEIENNALNIRNDWSGVQAFILWFEIRRDKGGKFLLHVSAPNIEVFNISGRGLIEFEPEVNMESLTINTIGGGRINLPMLNVNTLRINRSVGGYIDVSGNIDVMTLTTRGGGTTNISGTIDEMIFTASGGGRNNLSDIKVNNLNLVRSGGGITSISGNTEDASITLSGGGRLNAEDFVITNANIVLSGGVYANIHVLDQLNINVSGGGRVTYRGNPRIRQHLSGGASLSYE